MAAGRPCGLLRAVFFYLCAIKCGLVSAFNVDTEHCVRHYGPPGSMFGFTVAEHREAGSSWVLVGAPEAQTTQPGVVRGGAVFRCDIATENACQEIPFDTTGNNNSSRGTQVDNKSNQWFGASLSTSGENGVVVACAPRYIWYSVDFKKREPVGTCFVSKKSFSDFSEYSPCRTQRNWGYHRQGTCQAGLGAAVSKDGERLFIGAPGSYYWQGQLFSIDSNEPIYFPSYLHSQILMDYEPGLQGQVISQNLYDRPELKATKEGPKTDDDSYLGYSVAAGTFSGESGVAVGMPRGAKLLGKVALYTTNMTNLQNITGEQLGAYFGYAVTTCDVDGDGADDLIIGAPMYTNANNNYETGRVYVVYQGRETFKFNRVHSRYGKNSKARFGLSLCNLGDINKDGYGDFAVGAPYDGPNERGVVYIYHGSREGVRENPSQVITAEDVTKFGIISPPTTFGFSLAGGIDLDENQYPDLVIGAYESNTAFFLRSRPVVKVRSSLNFTSESKQIILEEKNCTLKDSSKVTCLNLTACLEFDGIGVDRETALNVQILLDSKKPKSSRMFFLSIEGKNKVNQTLKLIAGTQFCKSMFVYVKPLVRDKLTALEAEMTYSLVEQVKSTRLNRQLSPILDMDDEMGLVSRDSVSIEKNCGKDDVCIPDLKLTTVSNLSKYILGSGSRLEVDVLVKNDGEDSFETSYQMGVPVGLNFVNVQRYEEGDRDVPLTCTPPSYLNNNTLHCDIGNPLPSNKMIHFKVLLQPSFQETLKPRYEFWMAVNSTNPEVSTTTTDNRQDMTIPIWVETDLVVEGSSHPSDLHYNASLYESTTITEENQAGPQLVHIYNIRNKGPSDILEAEAYFLWPAYTVEGDNLLYLLEQPETSGSISCEIVDNVNEKKLKLEKKKSYLETAGVIGTAAGLSSMHHSGYSDIEDKSGVSYSEGKSVLQSSSFAGQTVSGSRQAQSGSSYSASGISQHVGSQGRHYQTDYSETGFGGAANVKQNAEGKIAYETSVADLAPATDEKHEEEIHTNVIEDKVLQHGTIEHGSSYGAIGLGTLESSGQNNYEGSSRGYGSGSAGGSGYSSGSGSTYSSNSYNTASGGSTGYNAARGYASGTGSRYGGSSQAEANAAWAQGGGRAIHGAAKNLSSFHSVEKSHSSNTTWDPLHNTPITSSQDSWRTNDNGLVRNGSTSAVYSEPSGNVYMGGTHSVSGGDTQYSGGESRRTSESETEFKTRTESVRRVGGYSNSPSEYAEEDYSRRDSSRDAAQEEQERKYQETLRKYYDNIDRLKKEDEEKRRLEDDIRRREHERYVEEQRKLRQYDDRNSVDDRYARYKRQLESSDEALESALKCGPTKCIRIKCNVGELHKDQEAWVAFRSRVWMPTIKKIAPNKEVSLSSLLVARVTKIPQIGTPDQATIKTHEIFTKVIPRETGVPAGMVPLWVVVLSAVAGAIILMLLVYLLYKWGFFKRRRPTDVPEKEPLNRNGYQHGDD